MTVYAKVEMIGGPVLAYPYTFRLLRKDNPNVSFPRNPTDARLADWGVVAVTGSPKPLPTNTEDPVEVTPVWSGLELVQTWAMTPVSPEEASQRQKAQRNVDERAEISADAFVAQFIGMTPDEVDVYLDANTKNVAEMRVFIKRLARMVLLLARREFED